MGRRNSRGRRRYNPSHVRIVVQAASMALLVIVLCLIIGKNIKLNRADSDPGAVDTPPVSESAQPGGEDDEGGEPQGSDTPEDVSTPEPTPTPEPFEPHYVDSTNPANYIVSTDIMVDGEIISGSYEAEEEIYFGSGSEYAVNPGVVTFGGNNYRDGYSYGTANLTQKKFGSSWTASTGTLVAPDGVPWSGNGWTGQPLITEWPKETRQVMNMYDWAKQQDSLVEVVYPSMDGNVTSSSCRPARPRATR